MLSDLQTVLAFQSGDPNGVSVEQLAFAMRYWKLRGIVHGQNWLTRMLTPPRRPKLQASMGAAAAAADGIVLRARLGNEFRVIFVQNPEDSEQLNQAVSSAFKIPVTECRFKEGGKEADVDAIAWDHRPLVEAARARATELRHLDKFNKLSDIERLQLSISLAAL